MFHKFHQIWNNIWVHEDFLSKHPKFVKETLDRIYGKPDFHYVQPGGSIITVDKEIEWKLK